MTEQEAKTKWCPMLQVAVGAGTFGAVSNRDEAFIDHPQRFGRCIGSACMAWRWDFVEAFTSRMDAVGAGAMRRDTWPDLVAFGPPDQLIKRHGYCGLAGKP